MRVLRFSCFFSSYPLTSRYSNLLRSEIKTNKISLCVQNHAVLSSFGTRSCNSNRSIGGLQTPNDEFFNSKTFTSDGKSKSTTPSNDTVPVALISSLNPNVPLKVLLIPINLLEGDNESIQKALSALSVLRKNVNEIKRFSDNLTQPSISTESMTKLTTTNKNYNLEELEDNKTKSLSDGFAKGNPIEMQAHEVSTDLGRQVHQVENTQTEVIQAEDSLCSENIELENQITTVPEALEEALKNMSISSMQLSFNLSMTDLKDISMTAKSKNTDLQEKPPEYNQNPRVELNATCIDMTNPSEKTVPLNLNALIEGTVQVDPTQFTIEDLNNMGVPEFNENITTIAAYICSTALQKKFAAYESPATHSVERVEYENRKSKDDIPSETFDSNEPKVMSMKQLPERYALKPSEFIIKSGTYDLMSPDTYAKAVRAAAKLREASEKSTRETLTERKPISILEFPIKDALIRGKSPKTEVASGKHGTETTTIIPPSGATKHLDLGSIQFSSFNFVDNTFQDKAFKRCKSKFEHKKNSNSLCPRKKDPPKDREDDV